VVRKEYEVVIKPIGNQSPCHSGYQIGDEWVFDYMTGRRYGNCP
jgi:hypothetical protein